MRRSRPAASRPATPPSPLARLVRGRALPRIHVLSDVHLEFGPYELPADLAFDVLVAAGDIGPVDVAVPWLARCGRPVVYVMGNHEYYGEEFDDVVGRARALARGTKVRVLERGRADILGVRFLGTTLWSSYGGWHPGLVRQAYGQMSDYGRIRAARWFESAAHRAWLAHRCRAVRLPLPEADPEVEDPRAFHPAIAYREHLRSVAWLQRALEQPFDGPIVVVTHHAPTYRSLAAFGVDEDALRPEAWNSGEYLESLRRVAAYASPLDGLLALHRDRIDLWAHGHLHAGLDVVASGVRVLANPRGYAEGVRSLRGVRHEAGPAPGGNPHPGRSPGFDWRLVVDLTDGLARPLDRALTEPRNAMRRLAVETEALRPHLDRGVSVASIALREAHARRIEAFAHAVDAAVTNLARALDAGTRRVPLVLLGLPEDRPEAPPAQVPADLHARAAWQQACMEAWIAWADVAVGAAGRRLHAWVAATRRMLDLARGLGIEARCVRPPLPAFRRLGDSQRHLLFAAADDAGLAELGRRVTRAFEAEVPRRTIRLAHVDHAGGLAAALIGLEDLPVSG